MSIPIIYRDEVVSESQWIEINKSYRFEMRPTKKQEVKLLRTLETCRHLHNWSLGERKDGWENGGWRVRYIDQQNYLPILRGKNDDFGNELNEVHSQVEQNQLKRVDEAYNRFFERVKNNKKNPKKYKKPGHPRFKGRNRMKSFTFPQYGNGCHILDRKGRKNVKGDILRLSGIGDIKFIKHIEIGDPGIPFVIKTVTVKKEVDKWIVIFAIETFSEIEIPVNNISKNVKKDNNIKTIEILKEELNIINNKHVGNDMGLPNLLTNSNGENIEVPKYLEKSSKRLRKEQQKLARKKKYDEIDENGKIKKDPKTGKKLWKGSKNREKQRIKVAKTHRYVKNQRRDFGHCTSKKLKNDNDLNVFEKLPIQKMMKDRRYAKGIADASWGQVQRFTEYKAEENAARAAAGKKVDFVDPAYTSQICSNCGRLIGEEWIDRDKEIFHCPFCELTINIHVNAARNIRNRSPIYQQKLEYIFQRLSKEMEETIILSEKKLSSDIYCWSLDPEDSWTDDNRISRDAAARRLPAPAGRLGRRSRRIYAFGEVISTHIGICEQITSSNQEAMRPKKDGYLVGTKLQAPSFRAE